MYIALWKILLVEWWAITQAQPPIFVLVLATRGTACMW
jgi:hypothetical protein